MFPVFEESIRSNAILISIFVENAEFSHELAPNSVGLVLSREE